MCTSSFAVNLAYVAVLRCLVDHEAHFFREGSETYQ